MKFKPTIEDFQLEEIVDYVVSTSISDMIDKIELELADLVGEESDEDTQFWDLDEDTKTEMYAKVLEQVIPKMPKTWKEYLDRNY